MDRRETLRRIDTARRVIKYNDPVEGLTKKQLSKFLADTRDLLGAAEYHLEQMETLGLFDRMVLDRSDPDGHPRIKLEVTLEDMDQLRWLLDLESDST